MNWRDFMYGIRHVGRACAREKLRMFDAISAPNREEDDLSLWVQDQRARGGLT